jgi:hypothetical protein
LSRRHRVGGCCSRWSGSRTAAATVPTVPSRPSGETSERTSRARVNTQSAQSMLCKGEPNDRGRRRNRFCGPPRRGSRRFPRTTTPGVTVRGTRGFFPSGFPFHVVAFDPLHPFTVIPTAGGEASAAAAQPRFGAAGGAAASRSLRGYGRGYEYGSGPPAMGMRRAVTRFISGDTEGLAT